MDEGRNRWWKDPRGIAAIIAIVVLILVQPALFAFGIFYSREKQLWDIFARLSAAERNINERIAATEINERSISAVRDRIAENERRLEINAQRIIRMEGIIDRIYPPGKQETDTQ